MDALRVDSCPPIWKKNQIGLSKNHKIIEKGKSESTCNTLENKIKNIISTDKNSLTLDVQV